MPTTLSPLSRRLVLGALAGAALPAWAWGETVKGSGRPATETRTPGSFEAVSVSGPFDVELRQTGKEAVTLTADDNVLPVVEAVVDTGVRGATLQLRIKRGVSVQVRTPIKVVVDLQRLSALSIAGAGDALVGALQTPALRVAIAGSGDVRMEGLKTGQLEAKVAGSGNVRATGQAAQAQFSISGSGEIDTRPLAVDDLSVSIAGSGDAKVTANKSLKVSIAGSGDVVWSGTATEVTQRVAGSGQVSRR